VGKRIISKKKTRNRTGFESQDWLFIEKKRVIEGGGGRAKRHKKEKTKEKLGISGESRRKKGELEISATISLKERGEGTFAICQFMFVMVGGSWGGEGPATKGVKRRGKRITSPWGF